MLKGGIGRDTLYGGAGADDLYAGSDDDRDIFVFTATSDSGTTSSTWDQIFQFDRKGSGETVYDCVDLSGFDADPASGDQSFRFVSQFKAAGSGESDGQICVDGSGSSARVLIDFNGDRTTDMIIQVMDVSTLVKGDFLL